MPPKLSGALKTLVLQNGSPSLQISPSFHALLFQISSQAKRHQLSDKIWLSITTATLFASNSPNGLKETWNFVKKEADSRQAVKRAALMREVGLKCTSFIGIPKVINNMGVLHESFGQQIVNQLPQRSRREITSDSLQTVMDRGHQTWSSIYTPLDAKLIAKLSSYHPDLPVHILQSHYAALLADDPMYRGLIGYLGRVTLSVVAIACLRAQGEVGPQVLSHVFGLMKALEENIDTNEVKDLGEGWRWLAGEQGIEWILNTVDSVKAASNGQNKAKL